MAVDIKNLIAAINPDIYCVKTKEEYGKIIDIRGEVKNLIKNNYSSSKPSASIYLEAANKAKLIESLWFDLDAIISKPMDAPGLKNPIEQHSITYEVSGQSIEQLYFWLHDYLYNTSEYGKAEKILDNFIASPGSSYFAELTVKTRTMQEEAMKILGAINQVVKSVLNITYDLKEFKTRLKYYDELKDEKTRDGALISLKQIWLDQVDIKRGNTSIKALAVSGAQAPNFVMLIDAFMAAKSSEDAKKMDLNEIVKRILVSRYQEFENWLKESEKELRKRYEIEKAYLKSQYNTLQLYARWVKPYLRAARLLEQRAEHPSAIVSLFETSYFELALLGMADYNVLSDIGKGELPKIFALHKTRKYFPCVLVELKFRTYPSSERTQRGGHAFIGQAQITFTSFSLNEDEIKLLKNQLEKDNFKDLIQLTEGATTESIEQLKYDVEEFLEEPKKEEKKEEKEVNPFSALFSIFKKEKTETSKEKKKEEDIALKPIKSDDAFEKVIRSQTAIEGRRKCRKFYESFKKTYGMFSF
ncbi:MAG: hypothetical protein N3D20_01070 [Candidatus Pacearchaeota archaeon]|nr:hypothetical protein [Candidatus Pacearchaeota archaeon]